MFDTNGYMSPWQHKTFGPSCPNSCLILDKRMSLCSCNIHWFFFNNSEYFLHPTHLRIIKLFSLRANWTWSACWGLTSWDTPILYKDNTLLALCWFVYKGNTLLALCWFVYKDNTLLALCWFVYKGNTLLALCWLCTKSIHSLCIVDTPCVATSDVGIVGFGACVKCVIIKASHRHKQNTYSQSRFIRPGDGQKITTCYAGDKASGPHLIQPRRLWLWFIGSKGAS